MRICALVENRVGAKLIDRRRFDFRVAVCGQMIRSQRVDGNQNDRRALVLEQVFGSPACRKCDENENHNFGDTHARHCRTRKNVAPALSRQRTG